MARIAIIGGGLMGHGVAQVFACAGHDVRITDPVAAARERILGRIWSAEGQSACAPK
jgi:3-hydroxybutyryl-CoA dehydrogenase